MNSAAFVQDTEAVRIAVGCQAEFQAILLHHLFQFAQLFISRFGMMAAKVDVARRVERHRRDVLLLQKAVEIACAGTVQRVVGERQIGVADLFDIDLGREIPEISRADIDAFNKLIVGFCGEFPVRFLKFDDLVLNFGGDFRKGWSAVGRREFQPIVFAGIVARRDIDGAVELLLHDRECDAWRRNGL